VVLDRVDGQLPVLLPQLDQPLGEPDANTSGVVNMVMSVMNPP
jgi:hypothetical protein